MPNRVHLLEAVNCGDSLGCSAVYNDGVLTGGFSALKAAPLQKMLSL